MKRRSHGSPDGTGIIEVDRVSDDRDIDESKACCSTEDRPEIARIRRIDKNDMGTLFKRCFCFQKFSDNITIAFRRKNVERFVIRLDTDPMLCTKILQSDYAFRFFQRRA